MPSAEPTSSQCYLEQDDPRLEKEKTCCMDFYYHSQTFTITLTHLDVVLDETIRIPVFGEKDAEYYKWLVKRWHDEAWYHAGFPLKGSGKKEIGKMASIYFEDYFEFVPEVMQTRLVKPQIEPPWVTNSHRFGVWTPRPLEYENYSLIEVMIGEEKCWVCWQNLYQSCVLTFRNQLTRGFYLTRADGSYSRLQYGQNKQFSPPAARRAIHKVFGICQLNPPGVAPVGPEFLRNHSVDKHATHLKASAVHTNAVQSDLAADRKAMAARKRAWSVDVPLDDDGCPLVQGSINGMDVFVDRDSYWKECYLSVTVDTGLTIHIQRTNGITEILRIPTNNKVSSALHKVVAVWRQLWPDQIPGFVCDLSSDWNGPPTTLKSQNQWFDASYGFEEAKLVDTGDKASKILPDGSTETEAHVDVRDISNGFGLKLTFGDGTQEVVHFHTADSKQGREQIGEVMDMWGIFQGETVGTVQRSAPRKSTFRYVFDGVANFVTHFSYYYRATYRVVR